MKRTVLQKRQSLKNSKERADKQARCRTLRISDEEKKVAEDEINAFKADPMNHSVEEITNKIYKSAFKAHKENNKSLDVFGNVGIETNSKNDATGGADAYDALLSATRGLR